MKRFKKVISFVVAIVSVGVICVFAMGAFSFLCEDTLTKLQIQNPYVNCSFENCKTVALHSKHTFCIPKGWSLERNEDEYRLIDNNQQVWANVVVFHTENDRFVNYAEFLETFTTLRDIKVTFIPDDTIRYMSGASMKKILVQGSGREQSYYAISLRDSSGQIATFVLLDDMTQESIDVAEAIMYSFAWPNRIT